MQAFKINFIELFIVILLSGPIGGFLFFNNSTRIKYDFEVIHGYAITANLCENFGFQNIELLNNIDIDEIYHMHINKFLNLESSFSTKFNSKNGKSKITFYGKSGQEMQMFAQFNEIFLDMKNKEKYNFSKFFKSINYNCNSKEFPAFKMVHAEIINAKSKTSKNYKNFHLYVLLLSPLFLTYLLLISYKYIRNKNIVI